MSAPIAYDMTRIATRVLNRTPNGIDRIDMAFAQHFLERGRDDRLAMIMMFTGAVRAYNLNAAREVVDAIAGHWGETRDPAGDLGLQTIRRWLAEGPGANPASAFRLSLGRPERATGMVRWTLRHGVPIGRSPVTALPLGTRYLNVSQFPIWMPHYLEWLRMRPDVKPAFYVHDMLPLQAPEYFRHKEFRRHEQRLETIARHAAAAIVSTHVVRDALSERLEALGRRDIAMLVAPMPTAPVFHRPPPGETTYDAPPYFVFCGTLEPRKNHLMILHVWRDLVLRLGQAAPKLILVGARGWENENIVDLLDRCQPLSRHVMEVSGLSTPSYAALLRGARALLMPSFAEGYGLPIAEALAAGAPVIASDIPVFREIAGENFLALNPIDGEGWMRAIREFAEAPRRANVPTSEASMDNYFNNIETFLNDL
jgi:glycosyltransferase involved in cell wall biosynthesis